MREVHHRKYGGREEDWKICLCGMENGSSENESLIKKLTHKMCLYYRNSDTSYAKAVTRKWKLKEYSFV